MTPDNQKKCISRQTKLLRLFVFFSCSFRNTNKYSLRIFLLLSVLALLLPQLPIQIIIKRGEFNFKPLFICLFFSFCLARNETMIGWLIAFAVSENVYSRECKSYISYRCGRELKYYISLLLLLLFFSAGFGSQMCVVCVGMLEDVYGVRARVHSFELYYTEYYLFACLCACVCVYVLYTYQYDFNLLIILNVIVKNEFIARHRGESERKRLPPIHLFYFCERITINFITF